MNSDRLRTTAERLDPVLLGNAGLLVVLLLLWPFKHVSLGGDHYVFLARHLLHGSLNVDDLPRDYGDYAIWEGHKYLSFGPLPALLLLPFLPLIDVGIPMVVVGYLFTTLNIVLFHRVLGLAGITGEKRDWTTLLYFGGTVYLSVTLVGISTYFAQVVVTSFLLLAMWEMLGRSRLLLVGLCIGLAAGARVTAAFSLPFFVWILWTRSHSSTHPSANPPTASPKGSDRVFVTQLAVVFCGLAVPLFFLAAYNYARFGSLTETGFGPAELYQEVLVKARSTGMFSLAHVPKNLFMMLLQGPQPVGGEYSPVLQFPYIEPSQWGMGLFFTSPALLYIFRARITDPVVQACWMGITMTLVPILTYYGIGYVQFGYRYALDFMPFLMLLVGIGLREPLSTRARALIGASVLINVWGAGRLAMWLS